MKKLLAMLLALAMVLSMMTVAVFAQGTENDAEEETVDDKAKLTVVHVDAALPGYLSRVDVEGVALINMVVEHGCQEIVCGADGVEVAGEVEVYVLHRDDLCVAASGSSSLYAENRPEGRLS